MIPSRTAIRLAISAAALAAMARMGPAHDGGSGALPWTEFYEAESGLLIESAGRTPACEPVMAGAAA